MTGAGLPPVVFLDRDGTVIEDRRYIGRPSDVHLIRGAARAIGRLNRRNIPVVIVTNQSGIGRGLFSEEDYHTVQEEVVRQLAEEGGRLTAVYYCPHDPTRTTCRCRKPGLALFERAARELGLADLQGAVFVGDSVTDVLPGVRLRGHAFLVRTGRSYPETVPDGARQAKDLSDAVSQVLDRPRTRGSGAAPERN